MAKGKKSNKKTKDEIEDDDEDLFEDLDLGDDDEDGDDLFDDEDDEEESDDEDEDEEDEDEDEEDDSFDDEEFDEEVEAVMAAGISEDQVQAIINSAQKAILAEVGKVSKTLTDRLTTILSNQDTILGKLGKPSKAKDEPVAEEAPKKASSKDKSPKKSDGKALAGDVEAPFLKMVQAKDRKGSNAKKYCLWYSKTKTKGEVKPGELEKILKKHKLIVSSGSKAGQFK